MSHADLTALPSGSLPPIASPYQTATPPPPPPKRTSSSYQINSPATGPPLPPQPYSQQQQSASPQTPVYPARSSSQTPQAAPLGQQQAQNYGYQDSAQQGSGTFIGPDGRSVELPPDGWLPAGISTKHKNDLQHLLASTELLAAFLNNPETTHPSLTASTALLQQRLAQNLQLAQHLNNLHGSLLSTRSNVQTHLLTVRGLESRWKKKQSELENRLEPWGPRELHQRLVTSIAEQEAMCQGLEESFIEDDSAGVRSERDVADWVKRVREGRKLCHLRRERRARWDEGRVGGWR